MLHARVYFHVSIAVLALYALAAWAQLATSAQDATPVSLTSPCIAQPVSPDSAATAEAAAVAATATGTPVDAETVQTVTAFLTAWMGCIDDQDYESEATFYSRAQLVRDFGSSDRQDAVAYFVAEQHDLDLHSVANVLTYPDGRLSAEITVLVARHWLSRETQYLVTEDGGLKLDQWVVLPTPAPSGATSVAVRMVDDAFELDVTVVSPGADIVFELRNDGRHLHDLVLFRLADGETADAFLTTGPTNPDPRFIGFSVVPPGETHNLVVLDPPPGRYIMVCFATEPDGVPHVERGMWAEFTVNEP